MGILRYTGVSKTYVITSLEHEDLDLLDLLQVKRFDSLNLSILLPLYSLFHLLFCLGLPRTKSLKLHLGCSKAALSSDHRAALEEASTLDSAKRRAALEPASSFPRSSTRF